MSGFRAKKNARKINAPAARATDEEMMEKLEELNQKREMLEDDDDVLEEEEQVQSETEGEESSDEQEDAVDEAVEASAPPAPVAPAAPISMPKERKQPNVRIKPNRDINTYIGDRWYRLKKGVEANVPAHVKEILSRAGCLEVL